MNDSLRPLAGPDRRRRRRTLEVYASETFLAVAYRVPVPAGSVHAREILAFAAAATDLERSARGGPGGFEAAELRYLVESGSELSSATADLYLGAAVTLSQLPAAAVAPDWLRATLGQPWADGVVDAAAAALPWFVADEARDMDAAEIVAADFLAGRVADPEVWPSMRTGTISPKAAAARYDALADALEAAATRPGGTRGVTTWNIAGLCLLAGSCAELIRRTGGWCPPGRTGYPGHGGPFWSGMHVVAELASRLVDLAPDGHQVPADA